MILSALIAALDDCIEQRGCAPTALRLPSCLYRALLRECQPLLTQCAAYQSTLCFYGVSFYDACDGT